MFALLVGAIGWIGVRAVLAKGELEAAVPLAEHVEEAVRAGDADAASASAAELAEHAEAAAALTSDPIWRAAEVVPWAGPNLTVMRGLAASVDLVARNAVDPLVTAATSFDLADLRPSDGRFELQPIVDAQEPLHAASIALDLAAQRVAIPEVASAAVIGPLADARDQLSALLTQTAGAVGGLDDAVQLLPSMLGADGPRNVLVLVQNNAELRSTGGVTGALALIHAEGGVVSLAQQASSRDFPRFDPPVVDLPLETRALWGDNTARYIADVNFTPQFPLTASIAREMWSRQFGLQVDGVIAIDPVVLGRLLEATGPITLPDGQSLTSESAVPLLLQEVYATITDPFEQDRFFATSAAAVFEALASGVADPAMLIDALAASGAERRILIWSTHEAEQLVLERTTLAGLLPVSDGDRQAFGVYLNDMTGAKMDPYLDVRIETGAGVCRNDGRPNYVVSVTLTNTAPPDAATSLPAYVTGDGAYGTPPGEITTSVHVYGTAGSYNLGVLENGEPVGYHPTSDSGYTLSKVVARLAPGSETTFRFGFLGERAGIKPVEVQSTPTLRTDDVKGVAISCDSVVG